jgi:hypothetical protein
MLTGVCGNSNLPPVYQALRFWTLVAKASISCILLNGISSLLTKTEHLMARMPHVIQQHEMPIVTCYSQSPPIKLDKFNRAQMEMIHSRLGSTGTPRNQQAP